MMDNLTKLHSIRVLKLDDDNYAPSYHSEDTSKWYNADEFIKFLTCLHTIATPYKVRAFNLIDTKMDDYEPEKVEYYFDIIQCGGKGYSLEEYQEVFNLMWKFSEEI